jgi:hypothetical protein
MSALLAVCGWFCSGRFRCTEPGSCCRWFPIAAILQCSAKKEIPCHPERSPALFLARRSLAGAGRREGSAFWGTTQSLLGTELMQHYESSVEPRFELAIVSDLSHHFEGSCSNSGFSVNSLSLMTSNSRSQSFLPDDLRRILWGPVGVGIVEGVCPTNLSSMYISAPVGSEVIRRFPTPSDCAATGDAVDCG